MPSESSAACPLPDGSLCGTCPDCQADAINDAQWPDGGGPVVIPEQPAARGQDEGFSFPPDEDAKSVPAWSYSDQHFRETYRRAMDKLERLANPPKGELVLSLSRWEARAILEVVKRHA